MPILPIPNHKYTLTEAIQKLREMAVIDTNGRPWIYETYQDYVPGIKDFLDWVQAEAQYHEAQWPEFGGDTIQALQLAYEVICGGETDDNTVRLAQENIAAALEYGMGSYHFNQWKRRQYND